MMMKKREFDLGDVLTVTTGILVSPRRMEGVYDILNYMTRDNLWTHQLPRAGRECKPWMLRQHPQLVGVDASGLTLETVDGWVAEQKLRFGEALPVEPIPQDDHDRKDPVAEAVEMVGEDRVIPIVVP